VYFPPVVNEEVLYQPIFMLVNPFPPAPRNLKGRNAPDQICPCMYWFRWSTFWAFIANYDL